MAHVPAHLIQVVPVIVNRDAGGNIVSYVPDYSDLGVRERVIWDVDQVEAAARPARSNIGQLYAMRQAARTLEEIGQ